MANLTGFLNLSGLAGRDPKPSKVEFITVI